MSIRFPTASTTPSVVVAPLVALLAFALAGLANAAEHGERAQDAPPAAEAREGEALLRDAQGDPVGYALLYETPEGVVVVAGLKELPPGSHGFHVHETGACDAPGFESAGGHFAPEGNVHGIEREGGPHVGDMLNIHVPESGRLTVARRVDGATLGGGENDLLAGDGTALVVHAQADDYRSQPSGAAGARIACGVIEPRGERVARTGDPGRSGDR